VVAVQNYGIGLLDNMQINWAVNGVVQTPLVYENGTMAAGEDEEFLIGSYTFNYNTDYNLAIWTSLPNGIVDSDLSNDYFPVLLNINDIGADSSLVHSADEIYVICPGDTINGTFPLPATACGLVGDVPFFETQNWTPQQGIDIGSIDDGIFELFPSSNTFFELNTLYENPTCCYLFLQNYSYDVYVIVDQSCGSNLTAQPDYGQIFFDNCDNGDLYFFIETPSGEILDPYYTDSVNFNHYEGMLVDYEYVVADFDSPCSGATAVYITSISEVPRSLELNIWLEGVGETADGLMETDLNNLGVLPTIQPFNQAPWFYNGNETLPLETSEIVDWVLVELRSGIPNVSTPNTEIIFQQAAVVLSDGSIVGVDNMNPLEFYGVSAEENHYVTVRHRNHLDVLSAVPVDFNASNTAAYDFTISINQAFGPQQLKVMSNGKYALYAGDYNADGVIQSTDYDVWQSEPAAVNVYAPTDGNLDGIIQATDFDVWFPNKAKVGSAEIQY